MSVRNLTRLAPCVLLLALGCDDPGGFGSGTFTDAGPDAFSPPTGDAGPGTGGAEVPDMRRPRPDQGPAPDPDAVPAYVSMRLEPVQTLYARTDHPTVVAEVFDRFGEVIANAPLAWSIAPAPLANVEASGGTGTLTFLQEGPGAVRACATPDLCGRATFFVDDGPPTLTLTAPTPGQVVMGRPIVTVAGTATGEGVQVFVNDAPVEVGADGAFQVELPAQFGFNRVEVLADDGVQRPPVREVREALYAPRFLVPGASSVEIGDALALRLSQRLLDTDTAVSEPDADGIVHVPDLAALLETLLARIEPLALLGDPVLAQGEPLDLTVESVSPGTPEVALVFTDTVAVPSTSLVIALLKLAAPGASVLP